MIVKYLKIDFLGYPIEIVSTRSLYQYQINASTYSQIIAARKYDNIGPSLHTSHGPNRTIEVSVKLCYSK